MSLSKQLIENLLNLVEIKISTLQVLDREDAREMKCRIDAQSFLRTARRAGSNTGRWHLQTGKLRAPAYSRPPNIYSR